MRERVSLGVFIARRRKYMGLTQEELAKRIGVSKSAIAKWETNGGLPDRDNLKKIAEVMKVSVDDLHRIINLEKIMKGITSILLIPGKRASEPLQKVLSLILPLSLLMPLYATTTIGSSD